MAITNKEKQTISFYDQKSETVPGALGRENTPSSWEPELKRFQTLLPFGRILDIGAGKGKEAQILINSGYNYMGIEPADGLREKLGKQFPNQTFVGNTVYNWELMPDSFDGFWCSAMLLHVPGENINLALQQIKKVMKPGALGFISLAEGKGEYLDEDTGRYFYLYGQSEFSEILKRNGFIIEKENIKKNDTHRVWLRSWLTFFVRVNKIAAT